MKRNVIKLIVPVLNVEYLLNERNLGRALRKVSGFESVSDITLFEIYLGKMMVFTEDVSYRIVNATQISVEDFEGGLLEGWFEESDREDCLADYVDVVSKKNTIEKVEDRDFYYSTDYANLYGNTLTGVAAIEYLVGLCNDFELNVHSHVRFIKVPVTDEQFKLCGRIAYWQKKVFEDKDSMMPDIIRENTLQLLANQVDMYRAM